MIHRGSSQHPDHLAAYLEASAASAPGRVAVVDVDGSPVTFAQLDDRAERIAGFLRSAGVRPGDRVAMILSKGAAAVAVMFGAMKAGAAYVPIDSGAPAERNRSILAGCGVRALFAHPRNLEALASIARFVLPETVVVVPPAGGGELADEGARNDRAVPAVPLRDVIAHPRAPRSDGARRASDLACILYTSGSTGVPKGVMISHGNAVSFVEWCSEVFAFTPEDRFSSHAPFHFDLSVFDIYVSLKHGAQVHLIAEDVGQEPRVLARFIAERRLTVWYSAPSILALLAQFGRLDRIDAGALRLVLFAGEVFPVTHLRRLVELWPDPDYYNLYGPTETNVCTFARIPMPVAPDRTEPYPIGDPCSHCAALVLDPEGRAVAAGAPGLLYIAGPSVFAGYWGAPDETAARFTERDGARWFNTGDIVRFEPGSGYIYLGRADRMVKRRGYRIELGEVESGLYQHDQTREAAVIAVTEPEGVKLVAFLVGRSQASPTVIELKQFCAAVLPSYMSPDAFVFLDVLPRTSTGKVDYQALARCATAGAGEPSARAR